MYICKHTARDMARCAARISGMTRRRVSLNHSKVTPSSYLPREIDNVRLQLHGNVRTR